MAKRQQKQPKYEERTLEVKAERMQQIMGRVAPVLDELHTTTLEDIFAGREVMTNGLRQLVKDNPRVDPIALLRDVMADVQRQLLRDAGAIPIGRTVGEA